MKNYFIGKKVQMRGSLENRDVWVCITLISAPLYYYKRALLKKRLGHFISKSINLKLAIMRV